ncbi:hypothetical protein COB47_1155 [Caldicellulosiruptor obsidiansis OB47]|uniref:Uncharacterized protein n=1 Tax=Caldicellulosiruptor obsidiansis (strain ATCC BAA-2073 / JCM 16842 / OB47) TaxID=608506 RepID=D9TKC2_CALOO|nr:hypothetical protein [Caldicellulosiruptor obsidiansis]ADL42454.1 hypothetical protein COB47_1155 [Caldicellulosiruptor obsidiansis OB47]
MVNRSVLNGYIVFQNNELEKINGDGLFGAAAGAILGFTYGLAAGAVIAYNSGEIKDMFKTGWTGAMLGGAIGGLTPF